ncbi:MAG: hypothetical protein EOM12_09455 [Verrucomicrobiae bacterium]|nr:hypothetical protein [Verrucomicrobiae bacterium]
MNVVTLTPAIIFTVALPLFFAVIMVLTRKMILKTNAWYAVFAFPIFFTAFEWLLMKFSQDGSAASIAYSQMDFLLIIQIASITGLLGITFVITLIPSTIATCLHFWKEKQKRMLLMITSLTLIGTLFLYGLIRINSISDGEMIPVGLVVLDEKTHAMGNLNDETEIEHARNYAGEINKLAKLGAELIVLPERAININKETESAIVHILSHTAQQEHVEVVTGYTNYKNETAYNSALSLNAQGMITMDYNKRHLVSVLEDQFVPGKELGLYVFRDINMGTAICKDLDFQE